MREDVYAEAESTATSTPALGFKAAQVFALRKGIQHNGEPETARVGARRSAALHLRMQSRGLHKGIQALGQPDEPRKQETRSKK